MKKVCIMKSTWSFASLLKTLRKKPTKCTENIIKSFNTQNFSKNANPSSQLFNTHRKNKRQASVFRSNTHNTIAWYIIQSKVLVCFLPWKSNICDGYIHNMLVCFIDFVEVNGSGYKKYKANNNYKTQRILTNQSIREAWVF